MEFVERAVHSHCDFQLIEVTVQTYLVHHGGQAGSAQLGGTFGHHAAHLLHQNTVVTRACRQAQMLQDGADLPQRQTVTVKKPPVKSHDYQLTVKLYCVRTPTR